MRCKPGGEEPEMVDKLDAAAECTRLNTLLDEQERKTHRIHHLLSELVDQFPDLPLLSRPTGRAAVKFLEDNPLPPATAADRDGGRSYGSG